jgi:branched-chain amino acid transport system permease protein
MMDSVTPKNGTKIASERPLFSSRGALVGCLAGLALLGTIPLLIDPSPVAYWLGLLTQVGYFGIAAIGLNLLVGCSGQLSFVHGALVGFGAFTSEFLVTTMGVPLPLSVPIAGIATGLLGIFVALPAYRLTALRMAVATIAMQFILQDIFLRVEWLSFLASDAPAADYRFFGIALSDERNYYYFVLFFVVVMTLFAGNLMRSRDGRALLALRDHAQAAASVGISLNHYRALAFVIAAFYAGIGGALMAHSVTAVAAESFNLLLSIIFIAVVVIGGLGSVLGSLLGTVFVVLLPELLQWILQSVSTERSGAPHSANPVYLREMAIGLAIALFLYFEPKGLVGIWACIKARFRAGT